MKCFPLNGRTQRIKSAGGESAPALPERRAGGFISRKRHLNLPFVISVTAHLGINRRAVVHQTTSMKQQSLRGARAGPHAFAHVPSYSDMYAWLRPLEADLLSDLNWLPFRSVFPRRAAGAGAGAADAARPKGFSLAFFYAPLINHRAMINQGSRACIKSMEILMTRLSAARPRAALRIVLVGAPVDVCEVSGRAPSSGSVERQRTMHLCANGLDKDNGSSALVDTEPSVSHEELDYALGEESRFRRITSLETLIDSQQKHAFRRMYSERRAGTMAAKRSTFIGIDTQARERPPARHPDNGLSVSAGARGRRVSPPRPFDEGNKFQPDFELY
ncbi:hypothetical protein EVAR_85452_1 [Eumeta japonica]|uniref:Uncharacterized protein n=1 Tax=Eumeta variegata TaxID=151549 RepID=A0A4C1WLQ8_EUMVA|nr:hypothetical protein EVAR_85452_1 [Eumeta japonica]